VLGLVEKTPIPQSKSTLFLSVAVLLRHHWRWRSSIWQSLGQPVAVWQQQQQYVYGTAAVAALALGGSFWLSRMAKQQQQPLAVGAVSF
jgi:hypothetical protein